MIYEPAEDSFLIEGEVKKRAEGLKVLDVGCGSGILMEAAKNGGAASVSGVDINPECVEFCRGKGLDVEESDLFSEVDGVFDLIVFNPPYLPRDEREGEESGEVTSGGKKGDEIILRFFDEVGSHLNDDGEILLLVSSLTPMGRIEAKLEELDLEREFVASEKVFMENLEVWLIGKG